VAETSKLADLLPKALSPRPTPKALPQVSASKRDHQNMRDVPEHYRHWKLTDYSPSLREAVGPFLCRERASLYLHGFVGTRKTSIAAAVLRECRAMDWDSRDWGYGQFVMADKFRAAILDFDSGPGRLYHWRTASVLALDDVGTLRNTPHAVEQQSQLLCYRYDHGLPTVLTSNLTLDQLAEYLDARIASRMQEGVVLDLGTRDWRKPQPQAQEA
jgi:DNA replication protein DnaC